jgi:hypothetical protein
MSDGILFQSPKKTKMHLKFLSCLTEKFQSAYSPYALNELNLALTHKILAQHEEKIKVLSFYPR